MAIGDGEVSVRVRVTAANPRLIQLMRSVTGCGLTEARKAICDGAEPLVGRLHGADHHEVETRVVELVRRSSSYGATAEVMVDSERVTLETFGNLCQQ